LKFRINNQIIIKEVKVWKSKLLNIKDLDQKLLSLIIAEFHPRDRKIFKFKRSNSHFILKKNLISHTDNFLGNKLNNRIKNKINDINIININNYNIPKRLDIFSFIIKIIQKDIKPENYQQINNNLDIPTTFKNIEEYQYYWINFYRNELVFSLNSKKKEQSDNYDNVYQISFNIYTIYKEYILCIIYIFTNNIFFIIYNYIIKYLFYIRILYHFIFFKKLIVIKKI
jgi:hypothetical protein